MRMPLAPPLWGTWLPNPHPLHTAAGTGHGSPIGAAPPAPSPVPTAWNIPQHYCNKDMAASAKGHKGARGDIFVGTNILMEDSDGQINIDATNLA